MSQIHTVFWVSAIGTWFTNLPVAYAGGITMGYGFPALWVDMLSMELFKVSNYSLALVRVRWADMADHVKETAEASIVVEQNNNGYTLPKPGQVKVKPISLKSNMHGT
ncbi:hypothetical protein JM18_008440 [Phytophthora kernoviae]|uniref:Uncharacterized protein n=1 Tax=Phytophthora kernoviae TaxID=325452 RepID=A0A921SB15_9STRA|nr:hypothetical protein JM18_008440 [Phytophthora kernoviae]